MLRVAGTDPGTSSLDLLVLEDGAVSVQCRIAPDELQRDPVHVVRWLEERGPFDLIAGPSGYGIPLRRASDCTDRDLALMTLVRPDESGQSQGVAGFSALLRELCKSGLPIVFLPGGIHLPTVPAYRKFNRIDLGTPDKLCVAALTLHQQLSAQTDFCLIELGSAFSACLVMQDGQLVDGTGGTGGPLGWRSGGAWDGETAYLLSPLAKRDLFSGGVQSVPDPEQARLLFCERLVKEVAGLQAVTPFSQVILSGRLLEIEPAVTQQVERDLSRFGAVSRLQSLQGAWVKHSAQGAALLADGLAGGSCEPLVKHLALREGSGTSLDWLIHSRGPEIRMWFA